MIQLRSSPLSRAPPEGMNHGVIPPSKGADARSSSKGGASPASVRPRGSEGFNVGFGIEARESLAAMCVCGGSLYHVMSSLFVLGCLPSNAQLPSSTLSSVRIGLCHLVRVCLVADIAIASCRLAASPRVHQELVAQGAVR
jgi:hypothetical protein